MSAEIISGKLVAEEVYELLAKDVDELKEKCDRVPGLAVILVGDNPASQVYVRMKTKMCERLGLVSKEFKLDASATQKEVLALVNQLNGNDEIDGILVQLPLPDQCNEEEIINAISPDKDVDGFHPINVGKMMIGSSCFMPCTPFGVWVMLVKSGYSPAGKHVVVVGRSNIVGKPVFAMLCQKSEYANATVTICHSRTTDLSEITRTADILIAAIGRAGFVKKDMVKKGAVVIDVGINRVDDPTAKRGYRLVGDVDFEQVKSVASAITPVPGGVGPMTIAMLMYNTVKSFALKNGLKINPII